MKNYGKFDFWDFLYSLHFESFGEPTLKATETQVLVEWKKSIWLKDKEDRWAETLPIFDAVVYEHPRGFAVKEALAAFTEWQAEYINDRDQAGYDQQQHDLAVEKAVERWFEEGIRS